MHRRCRHRTKRLGVAAALTVVYLTSCTSDGNASTTASSPAASGQSADRSVAEPIDESTLEVLTFDGDSMQSAIPAGAQVRVDRNAYGQVAPARADVIVVRDGDRQIVKRVIALGGEVLEIRECVVYIDGSALAEPYLDPTFTSATNCGSPSYGPLDVAAGTIFVMGDNRPNSGDSRGSLGPVSLDGIVGQVVQVRGPADADWRSLIG